MAVHLVCEGHANGLDNRVLNAVVVQSHSMRVLLAPSGGSGGLGGVRNYLEHRSSGDHAISVKDRDYYVAYADANAGWGNLQSKQFVWRRHEIENYLLEPRVVLALFDDYRAKGMAWAAALPAAEPDVLALLQSVALLMLENHTGEVLRVELLMAPNAGGNLQFGALAPTAAPGAAFAGQAEWVLTLQQEAARLQAACAASAALPDFAAAAIATRYHDLLANFQKPAFTTRQFLLEMGGHELMAALGSRLRLMGAPPGFSNDFLQEELLRMLSSVYQPGQIYQPDDFHELAAILAQY